MENPNIPNYDVAGDIFIILPLKLNAYSQVCWFV